MQPATLRRLLVFGVCLVGVGCLYLAPSMAGSPHRTGARQAQQDPSSATTATATLVSTTSGTTAGPTPPPSAYEPPTQVSPGGPTRTSTTRDQDTTHRTSAQGRSGATAVDPGHDDDPPPAVGPLTVLSLSAQRLTISWAAVDDDADVVGYGVWLNDFRVLTTQQARATLAWFNDSDTHVVQVRAIDVAGNEGPSSPTLLVTRPTLPAPPTSPAPDPTPNKTPGKTPAPSPTHHEGGDAAPDTNPTAAPPAPQESGTAQDDA